jgi:type VI protein secretion system component VasK
MLEKIFENTELTDEAKTALKEAFEAAVTERANERVVLEVQNAVKQIDEAHGAKLKELIEAIDVDHAKKFKKAVAHIDVDHTNKLRKVAMHYESIIKKDASTFRDELVGHISDYMDLYLEKAMPADTLKEAVQNTNAKRILESIKQLVSVDEEYINNNIREALTDGKNIIDDLRSQLNTALKENVQINKQLGAIQGELILEKKTAAMSEDKQTYIKKLLNGKSAEYIKENFNYVVEMFERSDDSDNQVLVEKATQKVVNEKIDTPVVSESKKDSSAVAPVGGYLSELKAQDSRSNKV